jgi:hypothetical protein
MARKKPEKTITLNVCARSVFGGHCFGDTFLHPPVTVPISRQGGVDCNACNDIFELEWREKHLANEMTEVFATARRVVERIVAVARDLEHDIVRFEAKANDGSDCFYNITGLSSLMTHTMMWGLANANLDSLADKTNSYLTSERAVRTAREKVAPIFFPNKS